MKVKEDREKAGIKLNIQKTKIMESSPITSWQIDREAIHLRSTVCQILRNIKRNMRDRERSLISGSLNSQSVFGDMDGNEPSNSRL